MKSFALATIVLAAFGAAAPSKRPPVATAEDVLNFALTLEFLEAEFYTQATIGLISEADFVSAGLPSQARGRFAEVATQKAAHVASLSKALGKNATQPCTYSFPCTSPASFTALSHILEGVDVPTYTGAAQYASSKATALGSDPVYSLAAQFITSCPSSNTPLPVKAFPKLAFPATAAPGSSVSLTFDVPSGMKAEDLFAAFYTATGTEYAKVSSSKQVTIPADLRGTVYTVITTSGTESAAGSNTVAGIAILEF